LSPIENRGLVAVAGHILLALGLNLFPYLVVDMRITSEENLSVPGAVEVL